MAIDDSGGAPARSDLVPTTDEQLSERLAAKLALRDSFLPAGARQGRTDRAISDPGFAVRTGLVEPRSKDPNGFERVIGKSDLLSINYLDRGRRAARAVCRIRLPMEGGLAWATGFLAGPGLLITNNHVLATPSEAAQALAEFAYEHDIDGVVREPVAFNLDPGTLFFTSAELDITLAAVAPLASDGTPLERYGWLALLPMTGKSVDGEWVSMVQHPEGQPKQIAIHASQIVKLEQQDTRTDLSSFIHYSTDTQPGSSGSPVLNDQWQVIAIHHKAVPDPERPGEWVANQGVRVSAVFGLLERHRLENEHVARALDRLGSGIGYPPALRPLPASAASATEKQFAPFAVSRWTDPGLGYNQDFLGASLPLPLAPIYAGAKQAGLTAPLIAGGDKLHYLHFSVVMHAKRRFPLLTAVNISGAHLIKVQRKDTWRLDGRLAEEFQSDDELYLRSKAQEKVYFSRGHQVRLLDPCWSPDGNPAIATRGMQDSFHFTNAAPQVQTYNDQDWGNLEDYVLDKAQTAEKKLTVFTGPIFRDDDPFYGRERKGGPWRIPLSYWKIAVLQKTPDTIAAAAFIVGQTEYVSALYEAKVFSGLKPYSIEDLQKRHIQTTIETIEKETGLDFAPLKPFDAQGSLESTRRTRWVSRLEDINI